MSHLSYQRLLPKTYALLKNELRAVILNNYNAVEEGTTANLLPLLSGECESKYIRVKIRLICKQFHEPL
jgi:hypothetical protein